MRDLDRFSEGIKDSQQAKVVCDCDSCGNEIYEGAALVTSTATDDERFCSVGCLLNFIDMQETDA